MNGSDLRRILAAQAKQYADAQAIPHCIIYGDSAVVCFYPYDDETRHGNFLSRNYKAIRAQPEWRKRLAKVHTLGKRSFPARERGRWMELDTSTSSDALLMNIICCPGVLRDRRVLALLGAEPGATLEFGYKARVPLANRGVDRTEVDLRLGDVLIEAKLTESDFQSATRKTLLAYRDFSEVFDERRLPQRQDRYACYQLLRNVLAAYASKDSRHKALAGMDEVSAFGWPCTFRDLAPTTV